MEEGRSAFKILMGKRTGKRPLGTLIGVDGRTILQWTLNKKVPIRGIRLTGLRIWITGEPL